MNRSQGTLKKYSETSVSGLAKGIKHLAQKGKSEVVQLNAHTLTAKVLQMTREPEINQGMQIVITGSQEEQAATTSTPYRPTTIYIEQQARKTSTEL